MDENHLNAKSVSGKIGIALFFMTLVAYAVQFTVSILISLFFPDATAQPWYIWGMTVISLYLTAFPVYLKIMKNIPSFDLKNEKKYSVSDMVSLVFICLAATYLFNFVSLGLNEMIGYLKGSQVINPLESAVGSSNIIYTFIVACIMAPIVEEIIFRKVMIDKLVGYGEKLAVIVSAFAFALFHGNLYQLLYAFVLGLIFAHITVKSGTIKYAVILHVVINTLGSVIIPNLALSSNEVIMGFAGLIVIIALITGTILFIVKRKDLFPALKEAAELGQNTVKISTSLLSGGMVLFWVVSVMLILIATFI